MGLTALLPVRRVTDFYRLKDPSLSAGFEPANPASNGNLENHYITGNNSRLR
jgi:hypothetical protein